MNTWTGATGNVDVNDPGNWSFGVVPRPGDMANVPIEVGRRMCGSPLMLNDGPPVADEPITVGPKWT